MFINMTEDTRTWWLEAIKSLGFPIFMCCALMYGGYQFITPVITAQVKAVEDVSRTQEQLVPAISALKDAQAQQIATLAALKDEILQMRRNHEDNQKELISTLRKIEENTQKQ